MDILMQVWFYEAEYIRMDLDIGRFLETAQRPDGLTDQQFAQFRKKALTFFIRDGILFKRNRRRGGVPRRVVGTQDQRREVIRELHDENGHRGRVATYDHVARRYQWKGMYDDCARFVDTCEECQRRSRMRYEEPLHPTWMTTVWEKVGLDVVKMPNSGGYTCIVFARDDL